MGIDPQKIEDRLDKVVVAGTPISMDLGGVKFENYIQLMEFARLMSLSGAAVPAHCREKPGVCLAVATKALRFNFDPFALAEHSFVMKKSQKAADGGWEDIETIAYDSFVIHAIIEAHAPITGRLRPQYEGDGDNLKVTVLGTPRGEKEPLVHVSRTVGEAKASIGRNDKGKLKGSPLWETKPDVQIWYDARRDWCRKFYPEVLMGWYDKDEFEEHVRGATAENITPAKPSIGERLKGGGKRGFAKDNVDRALEHKPGEAVPEMPAQISEMVSAGIQQASAAYDQAARATAKAEQAKPAEERHHSEPTSAAE